MDSKSGLLAKCDLQLESIARTVEGMFRIETGTGNKSSNNWSKSSNGNFGVLLWGKDWLFIVETQRQPVKSVTKNQTFSCRRPKCCIFDSKNIRENANRLFYHLFWERCNKEAEDLKIGEAVLPRKRQRPFRYYFGNAPTEFLDSVENHY